MKILVVGDFHGVFSNKLKDKLIKEKADLIIGVGDYTGIKEWYGYIQRMFKVSKDGGEYLSAEDYFGKERYRKLLKKDEKAGKDVLRKINSIGKAIFVFGNTDDGWYRYPFSNSFELNKKKRKFVKSMKNIKEITYGFTKFNGVSVLGFGGYMDVLENYMEKKNTEDGKESYQRALLRQRKSRKLFFSLIKKANPDIMIFHYPPKGVFDIIKDKNNPYKGISTGIPFFREAIMKYKPKLVLCGHMHEYQGAKKIGKTIIVNPGDAEEGKYAIIDFDKVGMRVKDVRFVR